jgi:hypothetical protein
MTSPDLRTQPIHTPGPRVFVALWGALAVVDVARAGQAPLTIDPDGEQRWVAVPDSRPD